MEVKIEIEFNNKKICGILINETEEFITIKLESGYNGNFKIGNFKEINREKNSKNNNFINNNSKSKINNFKKLPKIKIIHTGGTIASKVDYKTGAVSSKFTANELLNLYPQLLEKAELNAIMIGNLFSEDMRFAHYNLILDEIGKAINEGFEGIIISHGTDTMHYTSAAIAYACSNLPIPIILVGAQRSSDRPSSDAYSNLNSAIDFILKFKNFKRVGICMHENICDNSFLILDAINAKKMHSTRRDAFKQINYLPIAEIIDSKIEILRKELFVEEKLKEKFSYIKYNEDLKLGFLKAHPNLFPKEIENLKIYDGVIIEGSGLGHLAINKVDEFTEIHIKNFEEIKKISKSVKLIMGTQTVFGPVNMNVYSSGRNLKKYIKCGNFMNLTTETLFIRLAYCLSQTKKSFDEAWNSNLEGFKIRSEDI